MFLSTLLIDTGTNPDRPRPGRLWLRNLYRVHQRLCMAFPSKERKSADGEFLMPYTPADFPEDRFQADKKPTEVGAEVLHHVHAKRSSDAGFLYRVDPQPGGRAVIVVLSAYEPDWEFAFGLKEAVDMNGRPVGNAGHLLAATPGKPRRLQMAIDPGNQLRFRLLANPTKRPPLTKDQWSQKRDAGEHVKRPRHQLTWGAGEDPAKIFSDWLGRKAGPAGFAPREVEVSHIGYVYVSKGRESGEGRRLRSVQFEGLLEVTDADAFRQTLASGIGPAKAFGFGLLSIAPAG